MFLFSYVILTFALFTVRHFLILSSTIDLLGLMGKGLKSHEHMFTSPLGTRIAFIGEQ